MRLLYFPDWVFSALSAQGYQRSDVLNDELLTSVLSADDVAFLSLMQSRIAEVVPASILDTFNANGGSWWPEKGDCDAVWKSRANFQANGLPEPFVTPYGNLTVEMMDEKTLVFYPIVPLKDFQQNDGIGVSSPRDKITLLDRVIQETYAYLSFQDLMLTPMMKDFLQSNQLVARVS